MLPYAANLLKLAQNDRHLQPRVAIYSVTGQCNLNCTYCEDFGARKNVISPRPLPFEQVMHILRVIRSGVDALFLTGGEPSLMASQPLTLLGEWLRYPTTSRAGNLNTYVPG